MKKQKIWWILAIIWMILILILSTYPTLPSITQLNIEFSLRHFVFYLLLSFLIYQATKKFRFSILLTGFYGLMMEIIQYFLPYRSFDIEDIVINFLGASMILLIKIFKNADTNRQKRFK